MSSKNRFYYFKGFGNNLKMEEIGRGGPELGSLFGCSDTEGSARSYQFCLCSSHYEPIMWTRTNFIITTSMQ